MLCLDHAHKVTYTNPAALNLLGYQEGALLGNSVEMLVPQLLHRSKHEPFVQDLADAKGWSSITLNKANNERLVCKYYIEECVLGSDYERIIFFRVDTE